MLFRRASLLLSLFVVVALLIPFAAAQDEETYSITILHTNDTHSHHEPNSDGDGGAARQATVLKQLREEIENLLLVDGGDRFTGTLFHQQYRGQDNAQIMNALDYDAMTLGNHEFDDGDEILANFLDAINFPAVTANVDFSASEFLADKVEPYTVIEVNGEQIGVIGLVTPETPILSSPSADLVFNDDLVGVTQQYVDELTAQGVNKIILVTHIGLQADQMVAAGVSGVDIIVGGHSHTLLGNAYTASAGEYPIEATSASGEPVIIVQAGSNNTYLGRIDVEFDANGVLTSWEGDTIFLSRYIAADPEVEAIITELSGPIEELRNTPVGQSAVFLVGDRSICRFEECNLGNLITDALRAETGAQIAIMNAGGIRANIPEADTPEDVALSTPEEVTLGEVLTVLPFGNLTSTFELTGADVVAALENGVSRVDSDEGTGRFAQVSGIRYTFDASKPVGERIVSVEVLGEDGEYTAIDPEATYTVVSNDFLRNGGDDYSVVAENSVNPYDFGRPVDQVVADYIQANSPVTPELEGRITRVDTPAE
jgi:5'-nucleotidase / UDP-sugar diphosphatase